MSEAIEDFENATSQFEAGDYQKALRTLSWGFIKDINFKPLYELSAKILFKLGATEGKDLFENALNDFNEFESFNNLGTHFFNVGLYDLALPFLEKAIQIDYTKSDTAHDLALAYSRRFQIDKAIGVLEKNNHHQSDFWNYWFWCKLRILNNKPDGIEEALNELTAVLDQEKNQKNIEIARQKVNEVKEMLKRYHLIDKPKQHIQDWHFIQYGGVILDYFDDPDEYEDEDEYVAGGRYVASWGSKEQIREISLKLKVFLDSVDMKVERVKYLNDKSSHIIGIVIGEELCLNYQIYDSQENNENCLIVGANTSDFDDYQELAEIKRGQVIFSLNHNWLESAHLTPDIIGFMNQTYYFPWDGGGIKIVDAEKGLTERTEKDNREADEIATEILGLEDTKEIDEKILSFYKKHKEYLKAIGGIPSKLRYNYMIESPVPGSYFQ